MVEIRRILCPSDFSGASRRALQQAARLAQRHGSTLVVLHVIASTLPAGSRFSPLTNPALLYPGIRERTRAALRRFVERAGEFALPVEVEVCEGAPAEEILKRAAALPADLLVIGSHGRGRAEKWVLGSVTERVLRRAPGAVMTVPPRGPLSAGASRLGTILWATDFSPSATAALQHAVSLAYPDRARLLLVHVVPSAESGPPGVTREGAAALGEGPLDALRRAVSDDVRGRCTVEELVAVGKAHREILRLARENRADLIVMGAQGADALGQMIFGSTVHRVVRMAPCPVLSVRGG
jgi:nucleotide-binding universal stress UspA family protein